MFQREMMAGQQLEPGAWAKQLREISKHWKKMGPSQREPYHARAAEEQAMRENAAFEPLPSKTFGPSKCPVSELLGRNAKKKISRQRAMATYMQFVNAPEWQEMDAGLFCADGALSLDDIDISATDDSICQEWDSFAQPASPLPSEWQSADTRVHHATCHAEHGHCQSTSCSDLAGKFVASMAALLNNGALAS